VKEPFGLGHAGRTAYGAHINLRRHGPRLAWRRLRLAGVDDALADGCSKHDAM